MAASNTLKVGDPAPDFTLPSQGGNMVRLKDLLGDKAVVLFFYPKDNSAGCTAEACSFRDNYEVFKEAGAEVIGISSDSVQSHEGFAAKTACPTPCSVTQVARYASSMACQPPSASSAGASPM